MNTFVALLGRQPELSLAELEAVFGPTNVSKLAQSWAEVTAQEISVDILGGTIKAGRIVDTVASTAWSEVSKKIVRTYSEKWQSIDHKQTLGISVYGLKASTRDIQKCGLELKGTLKRHGVSLRLLPNNEPALSSATSHHNKLGNTTNKTELLIIASRGKTIIAESIGTQNISALAARDQARPFTDTFVGMLPPKLALIMVNLATGQLISSGETPPVILDPFCGTGVLLQEAMLRNFAVYGTDLSEKMIRYSRDNLNWLQEKYRIRGSWYLHEDDATTAKWRSPINAVATETYLGQPFSAPPSSQKLREVRGNCDHIITSFLKNLSAQIKSGTPLCVAVPAWRDSHGKFNYLPLINSIEQLGYTWQTFDHVDSKQLLYFRPNQVVARQLLVLKRQ